MDRDPETGKFVKGNKASKGHGRPTRAESLEVLRKFNAAISDDDWARLITSLKQLAFDGNLKAMELLMDRVMGKPLQQVDLTAIAKKPDDVLDVREMLEDKTAGLLEEGEEDVVDVSFSEEKGTEE